MRVVLARRASYLLVLAALLGLSVVHPAHARSAATRPKLVCIVVIDQFREDYLTRFGPYFGPDGFNRLLRHGASFTGAHYRHAATYTGPGHALLISGSYPHRSGIVSIKQPRP
jgi:arylsulfatase A-like enzyme